VTLALLLGAASALAACGGDDGEAASDPSAPTTAPDGPTTPTGGGTGTTGGPDTSAPDGGDLPGQPFDLYPYADAPLGVVGVAADDTLNIRSGPGTSFDVVTELGPLTQDLVATGTNRQLDDGSVWAQLRAGDDTGWANIAFLASLGATTDVTSELGELPAAETLLALADAVAALRAPSDPAPEVTVVAGPEVADLGEVTVDVVGYGDDAVKGERLAIFATPNADGESFTTRTVEATPLCARGVTDDGLCV
jgi:hypothetical protein